MPDFEKNKRDPEKEPIHSSPHPEDIISRNLWNNISQIKRQQWIYLIIGLVGLLVIVGSLISFLGDNPASNNASTQGNSSINLANPLTHVDESSVWVERTQNMLAKEQKTTESLIQQLQMLSQAKASQEKNNQAQSQEVEALQKTVNQLTQQIKTPAATRSENSSQGSLPNTNATGVIGVEEDILNLSPQAPLLSGSAFSNGVFSTAAFTANPNTKTPQTYVPAGTFVRAVMLGGADAAAGVNTQSNPTPMLFRLLDDGALPNHRQSHLKDCIATAAVVGDISSERGQIRLERLSCVTPTGHIMDVGVEGTVFGTEGKNGVRGIPLWREGALLKRAFAAGALSGLSNGISQQYTTTSLSPLGATTSVNDGQIFKYGAASGMSSAMDKLADYNIRRADQYHPVIQLSAGVMVDVVFLKGFYLDGKTHNENTDYSSPLPPTGVTTGNAYATSNGIFPPNPTTPAPLPLTEQQIAALRQANSKNTF